MPELPEIEVLKRSLTRPLVGRSILGVEVHSPALREPLDRRRLRDLAGRRIVALGRRSKYLRIDLEGDRTLVIHLGMSGRLTLAPSALPRELHEHLTLQLDGGEKLRLRDPRRFGLAFVARTSRIGSDRRFRGLGLEPLSGELDGATLAALACGRRGPVKSFLMDGRLVVGVGNIYATEALFRAAIHPARSVARIGAARWDDLARAVVEVLEQAIADGGTTLNDFTDGEGFAGEFQIALSAYGREGEPCPRCGATIRRLVQGGRSSFYCPRCQR
ncbi:MAG: bifunctional DNA-formamidopyrimidine glycosylase/DNA-(apurinic or apyrimidinic site) lyase [Thermoanaerobaculia bacterium]